MVSQPLPAAWLGGALAGSADAGLCVGVLLQALWGREYALGGASFPLTGPASGGAGALAAAWGSPERPLWNTLEAAPLVLVLLLAVAGGECGRHGVQWIRRRRAGLVRRADRAAAAGDAAGVLRANLSGLLPCAGLGALILVVVLGAGLLVEPGMRRAPEASGSWVFASVFGAGLGRTAVQGAPKRRMGIAALVLAAVLVLRGLAA